MSKKEIRIVLVDDHNMVRETWKMILESHNGFVVVGECNSGEEAIQAAGKLLPDIMLMDINMSPVNGFEATRKILKAYPEIRIIGISINNQPGYAKNMMQLGASGFVTKNSTKEVMFQAIVEVMEGKKYICPEVKMKMAGLP